MKKILCYGDSNTFGFNPKNFSRFDENTRWTAILQSKLGSEFTVINEGMCDRTGFVDNPNGPLFSSQKHFPDLISKFKHLEFLFLWIGTNDLQFRYNIKPDAIEKGLSFLIESAQTNVKNIIVIAPTILSEKILSGPFNSKFDNLSIIKSRKIGKIYENIAKKLNCKFININEYVKPADFDGLHYNEISHRIIADKLSDLIKNTQ